MGGSGNGGLGDAIMDALEFGESVAGGEEEIDAYKPEYVMEIVEVESSVGDSNSDIIIDYKKSRSMLYSLMNTCQKALEMGMGMCMDVVHPRSFEVVNGMMQTMRDISNDLVKMQTQYQKALAEIRENGEDTKEKNPDETDIDASLEDIINGIDNIENKMKQMK